MASKRALALLLALLAPAAASADSWRVQITPAPAIPIPGVTGATPPPARATPSSIPPPALPATGNAAPAPLPAAKPAAQPADPAHEAKRQDEFERLAAETIRLTNDFRRRNGLPEFKEDRVCQAAAFDHARDMAKRGYFNHFAPDGASPTVRYNRRNVDRLKVIRITENIARGNGTTPSSALKMWLNSSGHRKHLVGTEMNHIGVGVANGTCFFAACTYFVQCFSNWPKDRGAPAAQAAR